MTALKESLLRRIEQSGPLNVAEYMAECLLHPKHGYYTTQSSVGAEGDFITAPEIRKQFACALTLLVVEGGAINEISHFVVLFLLLCFRREGSYAQILCDSGMQSRHMCIAYSA